MWTGDALGDLLAKRPSGTLTTLDEADAFRWLKRPDGVTLFAQTLYQADGFAVTLLVAERDQQRLRRALQLPAAPRARIA